MKKIKVCGMREPENIRQLEALKPDFMGFIFYPRSPRFSGDAPEIPALDAGIEKVGVFVNESVENVTHIAEKYGMNYVQLHGNENPQYCKEIRGNGLKILKAFAVDSSFDFKDLKDFEGLVSYFLFDTKGDGYGGHGKTFDWEILKNYNLATPFFVAGGVSNENLKELLALAHPHFEGIDVNSRYEISPGLKNIEALKELFLTVRERV